MSYGFNQSLLLGRLVAPPEQLKTKNGKLFLKAVIAVSVRRKNSDRDDEDRTSFLPVTIFGKTAEVFLKYVANGDLVLIIGRLDSNEWKSDDCKRNLSLNFVAETLQFLPNVRSTRPQAKPQAKPLAVERPADHRAKTQPELDENGDPAEIPF
jgi:single-strand DNA-binding protein